MKLTWNVFSVPLRSSLATDKVTLFCRLGLASVGNSSLKFSQAGLLLHVVCSQDNLMVCGIDSYHGGAGSKAASVGAFVASLNATYSRWFSRVCFQERGQELIDGLKICFISALKKYYDVRFSSSVELWEGCETDKRLLRRVFVSLLRYSRTYPLRVDSELL